MHLFLIISLGFFTFVEIVRTFKKGGWGHSDIEKRRTAAHGNVAQARTATNCVIGKYGPPGIDPGSSVPDYMLYQYAILAHTVSMHFNGVIEIKMPQLNIFST